MCCTFAPAILQHNVSIVRDKEKRVWKTLFLDSELARLNTYNKPKSFIRIRERDKQIINLGEVFSDQWKFTGGTRIKTKTEIYPLGLLQMSLTSHDDAGG